jgi:hypothetical protein
METVAVFLMKPEVFIFEILQQIIFSIFKEIETIAGQIQ